MNSATLSKMCRCEHARRDHHTGNIFEGYRTNCFACGCHYFEVVDGWQESFAEALRSEGYVVEQVKRDARGRFAASRVMP